MAGWRERLRQFENTPRGPWMPTAPVGHSQRRWNENDGFNEERFQHGTLEALGQEQEFGSAAQQQGFERFRDFDPRGAFEEYSAGSLGEARSALGDELERLSGAAVGQGRLNTGFFDEDQGEVVRKVMGDHLNRTRQAALTTAGMRQQQLGGLMDFGTRARERYLDFLSGGFDRFTAAENAKPSFGEQAGALLGGAAQFLPFL